jgi:hypothetical protein
MITRTWVAEEGGAGLDEGFGLRVGTGVRRTGLAVGALDCGGAAKWGNSGLPKSSGWRAPPASPIGCRDVPGWRIDRMPGPPVPIITAEIATQIAAEPSFRRAPTRGRKDREN